MTNQATVRSTGTSIGTNTSTNTCTCALENASIVRTLFDLFLSVAVHLAACLAACLQLLAIATEMKRMVWMEERIVRFNFILLKRQRNGNNGINAWYIDYQWWTYANIQPMLAITHQNFSLSLQGDSKNSDEGSLYAWFWGKSDEKRRKPLLI